MTNPRQNRRSFLSVLTSLAGVTAIESASTQAAVQVPAGSAPNWDLRWIDELKGPHKQVFDFAAGEGRWRGLHDARLHQSAAPARSMRVCHSVQNARICASSS